MRVSIFDIDGVLDFEGIPGVYPGPEDIIVTGRSFEEEEDTRKMLLSRGIQNRVFFSPWRFFDKTRQRSGLHKAHRIQEIKRIGHDIGFVFEDDPIQRDIIQASDSSLRVVWLSSNFVELENKKRAFGE